MIRLLLPVVLLCGTLWAQDQLPVPVQICPNNGTTCLFKKDVTSGNVIIIGAHNFGGSLTTPTDTRSTTWTLVGSDTSTSDQTYVWCGVLGSSGPETITLTGVPSFDGQVDSEWPASVGCTVDDEKNGTTSGSSVTTSSVTTTTNGDFLYTFVTGNGSSGIITPASPTLSVLSINGSSSGGAGYRFTGTNGSYNSTFNIDTSGSYVIVAFKPSAIAIVTTALPTGSIANSYSYTLQAVGGAGAYTWSISSGSLPSGMSISSAGVITGTPTSGTRTPTFQVTDGTHTTTKSLTLTVNSSTGTMSIIGTPCSLTVALPTACSLGTVTAGNCIVVSGVFGRDPVALPTDSLSSTFRYIGTQYAAGQIVAQPFWVGLASSTGSDTVTLSGGSGITAVQVSNCQYGFSDIAGGIGGNNPGVATLSGVSLTTLAPGSEILATVIGGSPGSTWTAGTGFVATASNSGSSAMQGIAANESAIGTYTPSFNQTANGDGHWVIWDIALRPSTSGPVATGVRRHKTPIF